MLARAVESNQAVSHSSVLLREVVAGLQIRPDGRYLDATLGSGGHAEAILDAGSPGAVLLGLDVDPKALARSRDRLARFGSRMTIVQANFANLVDIARKAGFLPLDGIVADLGFSSPQMADPDFGLSFQRDDPLDMRLDPTLPDTAASLLNELEEVEIARLFFEYGEERASRRIARKIVQSRPIQTTGQLSKIVESVLGRGAGKIHPATRTFQALRIAVNDELGVLERSLLPAIQSLRPGGRLEIISFHSLEDRIVKRLFQNEARDCICPPGLPACQCGHDASIRLVTKHPIVASAAEIAANPRARSAKLRIAERIVEAA